MSKNIRSTNQNVFADELQAADARNWQRRRLTTLIIFTVVLVSIAMVLPTNIFTVARVQTYTPAVFLNVVATNFNSLIGVFTGNGAAYEARFMVVLVCAVSGGALGLCGSTYQGAFNNPLAAPKTLGVMAGGALGALIYVVWLQNLGPSMGLMASGTYTQAQVDAWLATLSPLEWLWMEYGQCLCSIAGCLLVVTIVIGLTSALGKGKLSNILVIIFGQVFAATVTALISFARYYYTAVSDGGIDLVDQLKEIENYTMIRDYGYIDLGIIIAPIVLCMVVVLLLRNRLTLLSFGDDEARSMGIEVNRYRYLMIGICTVMTALAISFCGHVAFLGFCSGHLARRIVGPNFNYLLPASVCTGCCLLTVVQYICQSGLPGTSPYAAGTVCGFVGGLVFLAMVLSQRGKSSPGEWKQ